MTLLLEDYFAEIFSQLWKSHLWTYMKAIFSNCKLACIYLHDDYPIMLNYVCRKCLKTCLTVTMEVYTKTYKLNKTIFWIYINICPLLIFLQKLVFCWKTSKQIKWAYATFRIMQSNIQWWGSSCVNGFF